MLSEAQLPSGMTLVTERPISADERIAYHQFEGGLFREYGTSPEPQTGLAAIHVWCGTYRTGASARNAAEQSHREYLEELPNATIANADIELPAATALAATGVMHGSSGDVPVAFVWLRQGMSMCLYAGFSNGDVPFTELVAVITPAVSAVVGEPTPTPGPEIPLAAFQPSSDEFGATYGLNSAEKMPATNVSGFVDGDRIQYAIDITEFGTAPLLIQIDCARFRSPANAAQWIEEDRASRRTLLANVQNDQAINSSADETYTMTGLFSGSTGTPFYVGHVWFRVGETACSYQSLDEDGDYLQFVVDISNRVIGRLRP